MQVEKLVDAAVDLRISKLKAREQGIIGVTGCFREEEEFQLFIEDDFKEIIKTREYTVTRRDGEYRYQYKVKVAGLNFICITPFLFKDEDRKYVVAEDE